ncbi:carbohydrate ABC transporter permease [Labrys wisconsinensis]|uniref:Sorbitol/mannitol transport system permease protein n=1 Tax=Labrys wisconsinensis TaxID=425677 RepID=A0ABU0JE84_9HYPH|nr:sugar ABC transporter permease [Labrys wisconsinensis]MDQ0472579.1 sorbitol/mannitol transport system permease protein [Labrys wisconsinensis]
MSSITLPSSAHKRTNGHAGRPASRRSAWARRLPLLPALLFVVAVTQVPFVITVYYSVQRWNLVSTNAPRFVWFRNFVAAAGDAVFLGAVVNTAVMTGATVVLSIVFGGLLALGLQRDFVGRGLARTLAITPFFVMPVAAALFWKTGFFDPTFGLLGWLTDEMGLGRLNWISEYPRLSIIILTTWQWSSFALLILLAGLQSFPTEVTEAAAIDGAGRFYVFRRLTLPHLRPFIELTALLTSMYVLENFAAIAILTAGGPAYATTNLSYYVYLEAFSAFDLGRASAFGVITLAIAILMVMPMLKVVSGIFREGGRS